MAIDKNSNSYTFGFAILMVIVVGSLLAVASQGLKTRQEKNATDKKLNLFNFLFFKTITFLSQVV